MNKLRRIEVQGIPAHPHAVPVPRKAVFHCFSTAFEELRNGVGQFPAAIVEYENGTVETVFADRIRFLDPPDRPFPAMLKPSKGGRKQNREEQYEIFSRLLGDLHADARLDSIEFGCRDGHEGLDAHGELDGKPFRESEISANWQPEHGDGQ